MRERSIWERYGYAYMMTAASVTACASLFNRFTGLNLWEPMVIFLTLSLTAFSMVLCHYWKQTITAIIIAALIGALCLAAYGVFHVPDAGTAAAEISGFEAAMARMRDMAEAAGDFFEMPYMRLMAMVLLGGIGLYALQKHYVGRMVLAAVILVGLVLTSLFYRGMTKTAAVMAVAYLLMALAETLVCRRFSKQQAVDEGAMSWMAPVFILAALLLSVMPVSDRPIQWTWVRETWQSAKDVGEDIHARIYSMLHSGSLDFQIRFTGFSGDGHVGGNVRSSDGSALKIEPLEGEAHSLYLVGTVKNVYTKNGWEQELPQGVWGNEEYALDLLEFLYACHRNGTLSPERGVCDVRTFQITYDGVYTKTLFYPEKLGRLQADRSWKLKGNGEELEFSKLPRRGISYEVSYLEPNYGSPYLENMLKNQEGYAYSAENAAKNSEEIKAFIEEAARQYPTLGLKSIQGLEERFKQHGRYVRAQYTDLPEDLPDRVKKLAAAVTAKAGSDYEKMKAIEAFLSRYEYSLSPGAPPEEDDVADYFLFQSGKGYCTYFATAMAVLGRTVGIPTRYMQGYLVSSPLQEGAAVPVLNSNAHAWAEAYIQGVGWIPFEPSTGFSQYRYTPWKVAEAQAGDGAGGPGLVPGSEYPVDPRENYEPDIGEEDFGIWEQVEDMEPELWEQLEALGAMEEEEAREAERNSMLKQYLAAAVSVFLFLMVSLVLIRGINRAGRYKKAGYVQRLSMDMEALFAIWEVEGQPIKGGETFLDYAARLSRAFPAQRQKLAALGSLYTDIRYGQQEAGETEHKMVQELRRDWMNRLKRQRAWMKYVRVCKKLYFS